MVINHFLTGIILQLVIFEPYFRDICGLSEAIRELEKTHSVLVPSLKKALMNQRTSVLGSKLPLVPVCGRG